MTRVLIYLSVLTGLTISGCKNNKPLFDPQNLMPFPAMAQWVHGDTAVMVIADFFPAEGKADSFSIDGANGAFNTDSSEILLTEFNKNKYLYLLKLYKHGYAYCVVLKHKKLVTHTLKFLSANANLMVAAKGEFNSWNPNNTALKYNNIDAYETTLELSPGEYAYQLVVNGVGQADPSNPLTKSNGMGGVNSVLKIDKPDPKIHLGTANYGNGFVQISVTGKTKDLFVLIDNFELKKIETTTNGIKINIPQEIALKDRSYLRVFAANDSGIGNDVFIPLAFGKPVTNYTHLGKNDLEKTIMYFVLLDRFYDGKKSNNYSLNRPDVLKKADYYGGDLKGLIEKINSGYFDSLGVNALWISPVTQNPLDAWGQFKDPDTRFSGYHGYWPISSSHVDFRFGTGIELDQLLQAAHSSHINVYLDYVANHVHKNHPVFKRHPDWATNLYLPDGTLNTEKWDEYRLTTWFDTFMPTLDLENKMVANFMSDSALFWVKQHQFDGFRHDATKHIPESFWRIVTRKLKNEVGNKKGQRMYQIGETYGSPDLIAGYLGNGLLDAQFDFNLYDVMLSSFANPASSLIPLAKEQTRSLETYGYHHLMGNITGNQDKPRFISYADGSLDFKTPWMEFKRIGWKENIGNRNDTGFIRLAMFEAYLMTIPGIPVIYYGDEIGMPGAGDPDNRRMMVFDTLNLQQKKHLENTKALIELRKENLAFIYGDFNWTSTSDDLVAFNRTYFNNHVLVVVNKSDNRKKFDYKLPADLIAKTTHTWSSNGKVLIDRKQNQLQLQLPPNSTTIITIK